MWLALVEVKLGVRGLRKLRNTFLWSFRLGHVCWNRGGFT